MKYPEIARRFNYILNLRKMRAQELAVLAHMSKSAISHYVNGNRSPNNSTAVILGKILTVNPLWLMDLSDKMDVESSSYYEKDDTIKIAQEIFDNKELGLLFDAAKDAAPEDLQTVHTMLMALKSKEGT